MADSIIILPPNATTSGDLLDASAVTVGANAVKRERMVLVDDTATANFAAVVTTSGALSVSRTPTSLTSGTITLSSSPTVAISSGIVSLSSTLTVNISSGLITLTSGPVVTISSGVVTLSSAPSISSGVITLSSAVGISSGLITLTGTSVVTAASSGLVQVLQSTGVWAVSLSSGTITLSSAVGISSGLISVTGSSGVIAQVTSSGGMQVHVTNAAAGSGSTAVNIVGSGSFAPVTTSMGLRVQLNSTNTLLGVLVTTLGAPVTKSLTTAPLWVYSITVTGTGGVGGQALGIHSATSALSTNTPRIALTNPAAISQVQVIYNRGVYFASGLQVTDALTFGSTATNTAGLNFSIEYEL